MNKAETGFNIFILSSLLYFTNITINFNFTKFHTQITIKNGRQALCFGISVRFRFF